ncbi:MAG TPA: GNVR domain-containing protein, partial [Rhodocyclaceae bacterium]|nr:GNVR domain-containing protein [Rhodocyclaceae bacterium]
AALRQDLEQAQKKLSDYQSQHGITVSDERIDVENARLNDLSTQLVNVQGQRAETQSHQSLAGTTRDSMPEVLQSTLISNLKDELAKLEGRREEASGRLGRNHPQIQQMDNEIASLRDRIALETNRVASSIDASNRANIQREGQARGAFEAQRQRVLALKRARDEVGVLQNDVRSAQHNLDLVSQHLAQSSLESQTQQTNAYVLNRAVIPVAAASPRRTMNAVLGLVLGALFGIGAALLFELPNRRVRGARDLANVVGLPVLVVLGADKSLVRLPRQEPRLLPGPV